MTVKYIGGKCKRIYLQGFTSHRKKIKRVIEPVECINIFKRLYQDLLLRAKKELLGC